MWIFEVKICKDEEITWDHVELWKSIPESITVHSYDSKISHWNVRIISRLEIISYQPLTLE